MKPALITPEPETQFFAAEIRAELARRGWTYSFLADCLGESQGWVGRRLGLRPISTISFDDAVKMCRVLDLQMADVLGGNPELREEVAEIETAVDRRRATERRRAQSRQRSRSPMWITAGQAGDERSPSERVPEREEVLTGLLAA